MSEVWKPKPYPFRKVVSTYDYSNRYCRWGEGSRVHKLECGHEIRQKQSGGFPAKKRCRDCGMAHLTSKPA